MKTLGTFFETEIIIQKILNCIILRKWAKKRKKMGCIKKKEKKKGGREQGIVVIIYHLKH